MVFEVFEVNHFQRHLDINFKLCKKFFFHFLWGVLGFLAKELEILQLDETCEALVLSKIIYSCELMLRIKLKPANAMISEIFQS